MHLFGYLAAYWWLVLLAIAVFLVGFVMVAGRNAEGGFGARSKAGWQRWKAISDRVANVQARIILTVFYFTIMAPVGMYQAFIGDRLAIKRPPAGTFWVSRSTTDRTLDDVRRQS